jgi:hypothetical protein
MVRLAITPIRLSLRVAHQVRNTLFMSDSRGCNLKWRGVLLMNEAVIL